MAKVRVSQRPPPGATDRPADSVPHGLRTFAIAGILACVICATFGSVCLNEFAGFDDRITLWGNPRLHPPPPQSGLSSALWYWNHAEYALYIPVTYQVWALLTPLAQLDSSGPGGIDLSAGVFHAANLVFHSLTVVAVFLLLRLLVRHDWAAAIGALLYGLHPLQVESVAWASGLKDVLSGLGVMLALWQFFLFESAGLEAFPAWRFKRRWIHYALAVVFLVLAMLCKPSAMIAPIIAAIIDWLIIGRSIRRAILSVLPLLAAIAPLIVVARLVQTGSPVDFVPLWQRPFIATDAIAFYLYKLAIPMDLAACYARRPATVLQHGWLWWTWIVPACVAALILSLGKRRRWLAAAGMVMLAALAPVLGFFPFDYQRISTVADHYMYVALLGPALAVAVGLSQIPQGAWRLRAIAAAAVILLFLAALSAVQTTLWHDPLTLWKHAVAVAPESHTAHLNLGSAYQEQGPEALPAAYEEFREAEKLNPRDVNLQFALANALMAMHRYDESIVHWKQAFALEDELGANPQESSRRVQVDNRKRFAMVLLAYHRPAEAAEIYRSALRIDPHDPQTIQGLAEALGQAAAAGSR